MRDEFSSEEIENEESMVTNKDKFNNVLAYVPFLNLFLLFTEKQSTKEEDKKYSRQWIAIFLLYIVLFIVSSILSFKLSLQKYLYCQFITNHQSGYFIPAKPTF